MYVTPVVLVHVIACRVNVPTTSLPCDVAMPCSFSDPSAVEYVRPSEVKYVEPLHNHHAKGPCNLW